MIQNQKIMVYHNVTQLSTGQALLVTLLNSDKDKDNATARTTATDTVTAKVDSEQNPI